MKVIVWTRADGAFSIFAPTERARRARSVTFKDGTSLTADRISGGQNADLPRERIIRDSKLDLIESIEWAETEDEFLSRLRVVVVPNDAINVRVIDDADVPQDRTFRKAWRDTGAIGVDMVKAREIHRDLLRAVRKPLFEPLDAAYLKADEAGDTAEKQRIAAKKQALRDVTKHPGIEAAKSTDELKAVMPPALTD